MEEEKIQNQQVSSTNQLLQQNPPKQSIEYEWIKFEKDIKEVNYLEKFLKSVNNDQLQVQKLDLTVNQNPLPQLEKLNFQTKNWLHETTMNITQRLNQYGKLAKTKDFAKNTGAIYRSDTKNKFTDLDYYDLDDSFIDDGDLDSNKETMAFIKVEYADFHEIEGNIENLKQSDFFQKRVAEIEKFRRDEEFNAKMQKIKEKEEKKFAKPSKVSKKEKSTISKESLVRPREEIEKEGTIDTSDIKIIHEYKRIKISQAEGGNDADINQEKEIQQDNYQNQNEDNLNTNQEKKIIDITS